MVIGIIGIAIVAIGVMFALKQFERRRTEHGYQR